MVFVCHGEVRSGPCADRGEASEKGSSVKWGFAGRGRFGYVCERIGASAERASGSCECEFVAGILSLDGGGLSSPSIPS